MNTFANFLMAFAAFALAWLVFTTYTGLAYVALGWMLMGLGLVFIATTIGALYDELKGDDE